MELKKVKNRFNKISFFCLFGIVLLLISIKFLIYFYYDSKIETIENDIMISNFFNNHDDNRNIIASNSSNNDYKEQYIGILEIPKINLKRGIVNKNSINNDVNRNIYVLKETIFPNEQENSHIMLASHSGNSNISFFKDLNKLSINDNVYFYYDGIKYVYSIKTKYEIDKTGKARLLLSDTSDITLITCIRGTNKQVVYVSELINQEKY